METTTKTPVEIIQELLAIYTTRKDAVEKLKVKNLADAEVVKLTHAAEQSDEFIADLMNELSNYGDAVMANVDRENEYQQIWKSSLEKIDTIPPPEGEQLFNTMENTLKKMYQHILDTNADLPDSVVKILNRQLSKL